MGNGALLVGRVKLTFEPNDKGADYRVLTDTGCEVGAAWNKSAENLICTLAIRDPRQRAAINDFIGELAQRAPEVGLKAGSFANRRRENVQQCVQRFVQHGPLLDLQAI
jgi:hypothetical protein